MRLRALTVRRCASAALALAILAATFLWLATSRAPAYRPAVMKSFSSTLRTHCIGRFLIDLPEDLGEPFVHYASLYYGLDRNFKEVEIAMPERQAIDAEAFALKVTERLDELKLKKVDVLGIPLLLHSEVVTTPNGKGALFRYLSSQSVNVSTFLSEVHTLVNGRYVVVQQESYPPDDKALTPGPYVYKFADPLPAENRLKHIARNLQAYTDARNAGMGFCMNGVILDPHRLGNDEEKATFTFSLLDPKEEFVFEMRMQGKTGHQSETLHERLADYERKFRKLPDLARHQVKVLREDEVRLAGMRFQQWAAQYSFEHVSQFNFEVQNVVDRTERSLERPFMTIDMRSGDPFGADDSFSPYTLDQLTDAWDQWLSTLRLSPDNGGERLRADGSFAPPITARSGEPAPRAGLYLGTLPHDHPQAALLQQSHLRWCFCPQGVRLQIPGAFALQDQREVLWTWVRA